MKFSILFWAGIFWLGVGSGMYFNAGNHNLSLVFVFNGMLCYIADMILGEVEKMTSSK